MYERSTRKKRRNSMNPANNCFPLDPITLSQRIAIQIGHRKIQFSQTAMETLGFPTAVNLLISEHNHSMFGISRCSPDSKYACIVKTPQCGPWGISVSAFAHNYIFQNKDMSKGGMSLYAIKTDDEKPCLIFDWHESSSRILWQPV